MKKVVIHNYICRVVSIKCYSTRCCPIRATIRYSSIILIMSKIIIIINYYKPCGDDDVTTQERP